MNKLLYLIAPLVLWSLFTTSVLAKGLVNEFLNRMAEFAEREYLGKPIPDALEAVQHHLSLCAECREEYESLLTTLKYMEKDK